MSIGTAIREQRLKAGLTQEALARKIGVTPSAVGNYERDISFPKEEVLYMLFEALGCSPNELFGREETLSMGERSHLEKYRRLDFHGRELVDACVEIELLRCEDTVKTAARKGASGRKLRLKPRSGGSGIWDAPDYRGGR